MKALEKARKGLVLILVDGVALTWWSDNRPPTSDWSETIQAESSSEREGIGTKRSQTHSQGRAKIHVANVFYHYLNNYHYFIQARAKLIQFVKFDDSDSDSNNIFHLLCDVSRSLILCLSRLERSQNQIRSIVWSVYNDVESHLLQAASHVIESLLTRIFF